LRLSRSHVRFAVRSFARRPAFAAVGILSLALAIALNTTMYSVLDAMVNPTLDVVDPHDIYSLKYTGDIRHRVDNTQRTSLLRSGFRTYDAVSYFQPNRGLAAAERGRRYQQVTTATVAPNLPHMLGTHPLAGRAFVDADVVSGTQPVMITDRVAGTLFPAGEEPIGAIVDVDGEPHPVVGVLRADTQFPKADIWMLPPANVQLAALPVNIVRVKRGVPVADAQAELEVLARRMEAMSGETLKSSAFVLSPIISTQFHYQHFHFALIAAVVAVLLIACANLANLQLARGLSRARELAIRASLGATRRDIMSQLVLESAVLAIAGLVVGLVLTLWSAQLLRSRIPPSMGGFIVQPQTSWRVWLFAAAACVACVLLVGLLPAIRVSRVDPNTLLKSGAGTGSNKANRRQYGVMVAAQIALSLALLSGATIVIRSEIRLKNFEVGYDAKRMTLAWMYFRADHDTTLSRIAFFNQTLSCVRSFPNVADASIEMYQSVVNSTITVYDAGNAIHEVPAPMFGYSVVSPSEVRTYGRPILRGRDFLDGTPGAPEVIVDEQTARVLWPNADPVGQRIKLGDARSDAPWARVVGVVGAGRRIMDLGVDGWIGAEASRESRSTRRPGTIFYVPDARDSIRTDKRTFSFNIWFNVVVRAKSDPDRMPIILRRGLLHASPFKLLTVQSMEERVRSVRQSLSFVVSIFCLFAFVAIGLAALGTYGIVAHSVAERKRELGVRIALGATGANVLSAVLREGNALVLGGIALGLLLTKLTSRWLQAFAFEIDLYDAAMFAVVAVALFAVAVLAALVPAWRATRIDPVESLRSE
jgi:putative ABC transport system permease protein